VCACVCVCVCGRCVHRMLRVIFVLADGDKSFYSLLAF